MTKELANQQQTEITKSVMVSVNNMVDSGDLHLPVNYSAQNAIKSAYLILLETTTKDKKPVLQACSKESIANSLLEMVVQGLNPMKKQCYFIPYGNKLQMSRSYFGSIALAKRIDGVEDVVGYALYKDDIFKIGLNLKTGRQEIKEYERNNNDSKKEELVGAFAVVIGKDDILHVEHMTMDQIKAAWNQGQMKGNSGAHNNFPDQMAIKTVINRACKNFINSSDDAGNIAAIINRPTHNEQDYVDEIVYEEQGAKELDVQEFIDEDYDVDPETGEVLDFTKSPSGTPF